MKSQIMKPQDIVLLLKIISSNDDQWKQKSLAEQLGMSQSEISESVGRCKYSGLLDNKGKKVFKLALMEFLQYGIRYVFPQQAGPVAKGVPTAHSAEPLRNHIVSSENYVWPAVKGSARGHSIEPLYPSVTKAVKRDSKLHELLALVDALRVGRAREKELALKELKDRILNGTRIN